MKKKNHILYGCLMSLSDRSVRHSPVALEIEAGKASEKYDKGIFNLTPPRSA
ncbi:hypothetical protein ACO0LN_03910 [Undibacterium sp. TC9W]